MASKTSIAVGSVAKHAPPVVRDVSWCIIVLRSANDSIGALGDTVRHVREGKVLVEADVEQTRNQTKLR